MQKQEATILSAQFAGFLKLVEGLSNNKINKLIIEICVNHNTPLYLYSKNTFKFIGKTNHILLNLSDKPDKFKLLCKVKYSSVH